MQVTGRRLPVSPPSPIFSGCRRGAGVDTFVLATIDHPVGADDPGDDPDTGSWLLVLVPEAAWFIFDAIRAVEGRPTRSTVANDLLRRALSISGGSR